MIHHVFANRSNIGDWLSAKGIQRALHPVLVEEHLCDDVFVAQTLAELSRLPSRELVLIGGGGLFMDYFASLWHGLLELSDRLRLVIWGVGFCDIKAETSHPPLEAVREVVAKSGLCVVRDELTRAHLAPVPLREPVPCPSLLEVDPAQPGWGILHVDNYTTVGEAAFELMDEAGREFASRTMRPYRRTNNRIEAGRESELRRCLALYEKSDLVLSSALHGCVIGIAMGRPVLAVSGDRKIEAFMNAAGLGEWVLDASDLSELSTMLESLKDQATAREFAERAREANRGIARELQDLARAG